MRLSDTEKHSLRQKVAQHSFKKLKKKSFFFFWSYGDTLFSLSVEEVSLSGRGDNGG